MEPRYNEVLGTMKITLLYQISHIRVKKQRNIKSWDQQNYLVIRGFYYIRPLYNEVPLYLESTLHTLVVATSNVGQTSHKLSGCREHPLFKICTLCIKLLYPSIACECIKNYFIVEGGGGAYDWHVSNHTIHQSNTFFSDHNIPGPYCIQLLP